MFGECHAHIFMNGVDYRAAARSFSREVREDLIRENLKAYRDAGVRFVRDGGDHYGASLRARALAPEYGITYLTGGFAIHKNGCYGGIVGRGFDTLKEYAALVGEVRKKGGDFIKIMTSGIMTFRKPDELSEPGLDAETVREMVRIAHEEGFRVMSHTNGARSIAAVCEAGADSVEHGNFADEEALHALAEHRVVWVPTIVTIKNLIGSGLFSDDVLREIYEKQCDCLRRAASFGAVIALGSDAGARCVLHGKGICDEYETFREIFADEPLLDQKLSLAEERIRAFCRS